MAINDNICISKVSPSTFLYASKQLSKNTWYFITLTFAESVQKLYINGQLIGSKQTGKKIIKECSNATFNLGIWWNEDPLYFSGKIDELRIYTRSLKAAEIQYLTKNTLP